MLRGLRTMLLYVFLTCLVAGLLGGMLALFGEPRAGGPLLGVGLSGVLICVPIDFLLSWFSKPRPKARGFDVIPMAARHENEGRNP